MRSDEQPKGNAQSFAVYDGPWCDWCGHKGPNPCSKCKRRYESARNFAPQPEGLIS